MAARVSTRAAISLLALVAACGDRAPSSSQDDGPRISRIEDASAPALVIDTIARGLAVPWALAFAPDGRLFLTERAGRVRVIEGDSLRSDAWATFPVFADERELLPESGLMGIALSPDFATDGHVYVVGTFATGRGAGSSNGVARLWRRVLGALAPMSAVPFENRVYRLTDRGGKGEDATVLVGNLPANYYHAGSALAFGPDGMLYVSTGDALHPDATKSEGSLAGRILRYTPDGRIPRDNPSPDSPVFAGGLRNVQGLAWLHDSSLFAIDHGPSGMPQEGGRTGRDELNAIVPGAHYGWPESDERSRPPLALWDPAIAPAGLAAYSGSLFPWQGALLVSGLQGRSLRVLRMERDSARSSWRAAGEQLLLDGRYGRLRLVAVGPDGAVYVGTSNRDGRAAPGPDDDLVLRLRPRR